MSAQTPGAGEKAAIEVSGVSVRYGRSEVLSDVSLAVRRGQVFALLGRNGAGKSTLVRCLLGQQKPQRGVLRVFGLDAWREREALAFKIGVVPESPDAPPELSAGRLAQFCARLYPHWDTEGVRARLDRHRVPLGRPFGKLSRGQRSAVMLSLALGHEPELLVLDDPTLGLDIVARDEVFRDVIGDLADRGTTVFVTTHDLRGIEGIADRVAILRDARVAVNEELETLKTQWSRPLEEIFAAVTVPGATTMEARA